MTPVDQTIFSGDGRVGDCWRACVASLLDLPCADVPHFVAENSDWRKATKEWTEARGFLFGWAIPTMREGVRVLRMPRDRTWMPVTSEHLIILGDGPRGHRHCVVADTEKYLKVDPRFEPRGDENDDCRLWLAHDPHPSRAGLLTWYEAYAIVPLRGA